MNDRFSQDPAPRRSSNLYKQGLGLMVVAAAAGWMLGIAQPNAHAEQEAAPLPGIKVDLPPPPSFAPPNIPLDYGDGTVSIYGMRKQLRKDREAKDKGAETKYLDKQVKVKAYILEIYQCPVCPKKATCKPCDQPHFFLTDQPGGKREKSLLVADYKPQKGKEPKITVGKQYVIEGSFLMNTPSGFGSSDGLLLFRQMTDDSGKPYVGPVVEMEAAAAAEQAKLEKAVKKAQ